jgi:sulfonate transport system substrate-binding protein
MLGGRYSGTSTSWQSPLPLPDEKSNNLTNRKEEEKMKKFISVTIAVLLVAISGISQPVWAGSGEIRLATQPIPHYAPIFVAKQKKWVEEELVKAGSPAIKWTSFSAGPPINESFAAGQQDIGFMGDTPAIIAKSAGIDTRIIGITSNGPRSLAVVVPKNSPIKSPKDLKGRKVSVVKGSYAHHLLVLVLQKGGLTLNDIQLINLSQADTATAIANGNVEAAAIWEPLITQLESKDVIRVLTDGTRIKQGVLVIVAASDFIAKHQDQAEAVLRAYQRGEKYIKAHPKEAAQLIASDVNLPPDLLLKVFTKFNYNPAIHKEDISELKKSEAFMRDAGLIKTAVNIDTFIDLEIGRKSGLK